MCECLVIAFSQLNITYKAFFGAFGVKRGNRIRN